MSRPNAANVQRPGRPNADTEDTGDQAAPQAEPSGVAAAAEASTTAEDIDPATLTQPKFDPAQGWICPAPKLGTTAQR